KHRLIVMAQHASGARADITDQALYETSNSDVVKVSEEGIVESVGLGEAAIRIRAAGHFTSIPAGVMNSAQVRFPELHRRNLIDDNIIAKLRKFNIAPSEPSSDGEYLRRVCLDLTGTLPPPERVREFLASRNPQKRAELVETLLNSP